MFLNDYWEAVKHPLNALQGIGNRQLALIYYSMYTGMQTIISDSDIQKELQRSANKIKALLEYCLTNKSMYSIIATYENAYPGFKGGWGASKKLTNEIIFKKAKYLKGLNKTIASQITGFGTEPHAIFGALLRAEINGRLSNNLEQAKYQVAYILVTGESNLYNYQKLNITSNHSQSKLFLALRATKGLAHMKGKQ